jgi:hypothetical protein
MMAFRTGLATVLALALSVTACSGTKAAPPTESTTSPTSLPSATALPAGVDFPDTSGFAEGDHQIFFTSGVQYSGFSFGTPDGQQCTSNSYPDVEQAMVQCWGPRPDKGPGLWVVIAKRSAAARIRQLPPDDGQQEDQGPVLPAEHVLASEESALLCAVDVRGAVACRVGQHGFVLGPDTTTLF